MLLTLNLLLALEVAHPVLAPDVVSERAADRSRIQRHLAEVEADLRARDVDHLSPALQAERRRNIDRLHAYRVAGEFPRNSMHPGERVPYFIDDDGIVCAVGHLVVESGFTDVALDIRASENNARLLDMTHPALPAWIAASGLTAEECARIQPNYCDCEDEYVPVCGVDGKTYVNACQAKTCAGVEVAYTGKCMEPGTTGWPSPGTSGDGSTGGETSEGSESSSGTGSESTGDTSTGATTSADETGEPAPEPEQKANGCNLAGTGATSGLFALLLLGLRRRVRS